MVKARRSGYSARRRWSNEDARAVLREMDGSGLSPQEFAAREGLEVQRLLRWRRRVSTESAVSAVPPASSR